MTSHRSLRVRAASALALAVVGALALSGCNGKSGSTAQTGQPGPTGASSSTSTPGAPTTPAIDPAVLASAYGVDVPAGLNLTAPGSALHLGDPATIAWAPRTNLVGALTITVTRLRQGAIKDFAGFTINDRTKASTPYYVDATVKNVGTTDLSGVAVPLYLVDQTNTLYESSGFGGTFKPCAATPLPAHFKTGNTAKVCLVYLAPNHGKLESVSFRPIQSFNPIAWTGTVVTPGVKPTKKPTTKS